jgi:hypothetical protein
MPCGRILVESKWGRGSRFLHAPEAYADTMGWQYFRTSRGSHQLRDLSPGDGNPTVAVRDRSSPAF